MGISVEAQRPLNRFYRPELDCLRFFAFAMVFFHHALPFPLLKTTSHFWLAVRMTGALGVPVFFMLSAYLITELLLREKDSTGSIDIRAFYVRRILRIWPLYFLVLFLGFILLRVLPGDKMSAGALLSYVFLVGNWYSVFNGFLPLGLAPLWSLSVEEQFYLVLPSLARYGTRRTLWFIAVLAWIASQAAVFVLCARHAPIRPVIWANSLTQLQYFAIGAVVSLALKGTSPRLGAPLRVVTLAIGLAMLFAANYVFNTYMLDVSSIRSTYPGYLIAGIGAGLLLLGTLGIKVPPSFQPAVWLGKISYGLYVYHLPCLLAAIAIGVDVFHRSHNLFVFQFIIGLPLTIAVSALSYRYFESPFLKLKEKFTIVRSRAV